MRVDDLNIYLKTEYSGAVDFVKDGARSHKSYFYPSDFADTGASIPDGKAVCVSYEIVDDPNKE